MTKEYTLTDKPQRITSLAGMNRIVVMQNTANVPCNFSDAENSEAQLVLHAGGHIDLPLGPETSLYAKLRLGYTGTVKITVMESRS